MEVMARKPETAPRRDIPEGDRIAKVIARAGLCSRREAEAWIAAGRVSVNGKTITSPALNIAAADRVVVDGKPLPARERTRLFLYHKKRGLVTTHQDPEGRPTIFEDLPKNLPRLISVGRLDFNTEGLLLLTNDGGLARVLELPATGWLRRYRVRALGTVTQAQLNELRGGVTVDGVKYGSIEATLDREKGSNTWITFAIREGKNREVRNVLSHLGLSVNRLIRVSFGPFQLAELEAGAVEEVRSRVLRDQLGEAIADEAGIDMAGPIVQRQADEAPPPPARPRDMREKAPRENAPRGNAPREKTPREEAPRDGKPRERSREDGRRPGRKAEAGKPTGKRSAKDAKREWRPERGGMPKKFTKNRRFVKKDERPDAAAPEGQGAAPRQGAPRSRAAPRRKARRAMDR
jgi:23S rRNA pseudouridine2605 synthase